MSKLTGYIFRVISGPFLFFLISLAALVWLSQSLRFVDMIVNESLSGSTFLHLTALVMPRILVTVFPVALFAAVLYGYNRLIGESELIVMWATGASNRTLIKPAMILAGLVMLVCYFMAMYLAPQGARAFNNLREEIRSDLSAVLLKEGAFNTVGKDLTVYIRARQSSGELLGILVHDSRDPNRPITMMAERGALIMSEHGPVFVMVNGNRQEVDASVDRLTMLKFDKYTLNLAPLLNSGNRKRQDPKERYLGDLLFPDPGKEYDIKNRSRLQARGHDRIISPLYTLAFVLIALVCLTGGDFERRGRSRRIVAAIVLALAVRLIGLGLINAAASLPAVVVLAYLNIFLAIILPGYLLLTGRRIPLPDIGQYWDDIRRKVTA